MCKSFNFFLTGSGRERGACAYAIRKFTYYLHMHEVKVQNVCFKIYKMLFGGILGGDFNEIRNYAESK